MSGDVLDESMTLGQNCENVLRQFNASQNQFAGMSSESLDNAKFAAVSNTSKRSWKVSQKRIKPRVEIRRDKLHGKSQAKTQATTTCSFCQDIDHPNRTKCRKYNALKPYLIDHNSTKMAILIQDVGEPAHHKLLHCPPVIEQNVSMREKSSTPVQPWPMEAAHMILKAAYVDFDVVGTKTRFAPPPVNDARRNIVAVQFLNTMGADPIVNSSTGNTIFYYRAHEVRELIRRKMSKNRLLFDCMEKTNKL